MDAPARKALSAIQRCVDARRYRLTPHFLERLHERGYFWPDVLAVLDRPGDVRNGGRDRDDRPRWIVSGRTADAVKLELVCTLYADPTGRRERGQAVFVTIYFPERRRR